MTTLDILYVSLALSALTLTYFLATVLMQVRDILRTTDDVLQDVKDITHDARMLKQQTKLGIMGIAEKVISIFVGKK